MVWVSDRYVVTAGDVAQDAVSRGYSFKTGQWETLSGQWMKGDARKAERRYRLRYFSIRVWDGTNGNLKWGIIGHLYVVPDSEGLDTVLHLPCSNLQGGSNVIRFTGDYPMLCGVQWRVLLGALAANDVVTTVVGYEHSPVGSGEIALCLPGAPSVSRRDLMSHFVSVTGAAAATYVSTGPAMGETWEILHAEGHHDDPAGTTDTYWAMVHSGETFQISEKENKAQWARSYLYDRYKGQPLVLRYGDYLRFYGSITAAGKKYLMEIHYESRRGELGYGGE